MSSPIRDPELIEQIYETVARRESTYDGIYYTGVRTTGIFCRPSCRARTPNRENVSFYSSADDAVRAGFRPCKRCKPEAPGKNGPEASLVQAAQALIDAALPQAIPLTKLAAELHISPYYLQRIFKRQTGLSPNDYTVQWRIREAKRLLAETDLAIADIALHTGFKSQAYLASTFHKATGRTPSQYRSGSGPHPGGQKTGK